MRTQVELFDQLGVVKSSHMPEGFRYQEDLITEAEESSLVESLAAVELKPFQFHGHSGNRRVTSFGLRYDYARRTVQAAEELPSFLGALAGRVSNFANRGVDELRQCGINEYPSGAGIGWHKDKSQFGVIIGVSLLAAAKLRLRRAQQDRGWIRVTQILRPRSIYILEGEARAVWEHSIPPVDALRYSLTFRTLA